VITITVILNNYDFDIFMTSEIGKCNVYSLPQNISPYNINKSCAYKSSLQIPFDRNKYSNKNILQV
jgi:hypothetical protein